MTEKRMYLWHVKAYGCLGGSSLTVEPEYHKFNLIAATDRAAAHQLHDVPDNALTVLSVTKVCVVGRVCKQ